jgi:hypothetical protein
MPQPFSSMASKLSQNISLKNQTVIRNMELDKTFKYLGIEEGGGIDNSQMKDN